MLIIVFNFNLHNIKIIIWCSFFLQINIQVQVCCCCFFFLWIDNTFPLVNWTRNWPNIRYWCGYFHFNSVWWATPRGFLCCPLWAGPPRRWGWGGPNRASSCPRTRWPWCWCYRSPRAIPSATGGAPGPRHLFWPVKRLRILFTKRNFSHISMHGCKIIF